MSHAQPGWFRLGIALLVAAGIAVRVAFLATAAKPLPDPGDAVAYHLLADGLADGDGYVRPFDRAAGRLIATAEWAPAFPALLAIGDLVGLDTVPEQRAAAACLAAIGITLTALAGRAVAGTGVGLASAAVVAFHPLIVQNDTALLTEGLSLAAGAAVVLATARFADSARVRDAALAGALVGAASLVRADAIALVPVVLLPLCLAVAGRLRLGWRWTARTCAVSAVAALLVVAPWMIRNTVRLGRFVGISTNAATAVAGANCDVTYTGDVVGYWRIGPGCFLGYDTEDLVTHGEADVAAEHLRAGVDYASAHVGRVPAVVGARILRLWGVWDVDEQASLAALDEAKSPSWIRVGTWVGWAVALLAIAGVYRFARDRDWPRLVLLAGPLAAVTLSAGVTYGNARFRAGAEPALAILAVVGASSMVSRRRAR